MSLAPDGTGGSYFHAQDVKVKESRRQLAIRMLEASQPIPVRCFPGSKGFVLKATWKHQALLSPLAFGCPGGFLTHSGSSGQWTR